MKSSVWGRGTIKDKLSIASPFFILATIVALLLGKVLGTLSPDFSVVVIGSMIILLFIVLRQDESAVMAVVAVHLYVDWYLGLHLVALMMGLVLLLIFFFGRSHRYPWVELRPLWLWALFLVLTIFPAIRGALTRYDAASFYPNNVLGALMMFWLGSIVARNVACLRRFFKIFAGFSAFLAIHTIIQATTGTVLFQSQHIDAYLASVSNYQLLGSAAHRAGSFFIDPNWNGTFFAMMFFLPLGLYVESSNILEKVLYLAETFLLLPALLFTYSNGAWIGIMAGVIVFLVLVGRTRYRVLFPLLILVVAGVMMVAFPSQIALQLQHATGSDELSLRIGAWQTAIQVINAFPLTGVGLGYQAYLLHADPYRVLAQFVPLSHPHNSYLEWAAMAGLPVLIVFLALLAYSLWLALRNWVQVDVRTRSLIGGGIAAVVALSINSVSINGWTLPPLAAMGWLLLGAISSPLLAKCLSSGITQVKSDNT